MSEKLSHWQGIKKAELRSIPIICGGCGAKVSIHGGIEDGEMVFDNCPACNAPISGQLFMAGEEAEAPAIPVLSAEVTWRLAGGRRPECKTVIGETLIVTEVLMTVLDTGVNYYAYSGLPPSEIYKFLASIIVQNMMSLKDLPVLIQAITARIKAQDIVTESVGKILKIKTEDTKDDG